MNTTVSDELLRGIRLGLLVVCGGLVGCDDPPPLTTPLLSGTLVGTVVDDAGTGVAGVDITLSRSGAENRITTTDADGRFAMSDVTAGPWDLRVFAPQGYYEDPTFPPPNTVETVAGDTTRVDIQLLSTEAAIPQSAPVPLSPADGERMGHFPRLTVAQWLPTPLAHYYLFEWQYCGVGDFSCAQPSASVLTEVENNAFYFVFVGDQVGRWRVSAVGPIGVPGPSSPWRHFEYRTSAVAPITGRGTATIDGILGLGEWTHARALPTVVEVPDRAQALGTLYLMNDDSTLFASLRFDWGGPTVFPSFMSVAAPNFGPTFEGSDLFGLLYVGGAERVRAVDQHVVPGGGCGHVWCGGDDVAFGGTFDGATEWTTAPGQTVIEIAKPLASGDIRDLFVRPSDSSLDVRFDLRIVFDDLLGVRSIRSTPQRFTYLLDRNP